MTVWARETKGKEDRELIFKTRQGWETVMEYLAERDKAGLKVVGKEPVLAAHDKVSWGKGTIHAMRTESLRVKLERLCQKAGVQKITPHALRHRKATRMLKETGNLENVKRVMGHQSADTTGIYLKVDNSDLIRAVRGENNG
jgi:site-specific recombinase XerD